MNVMSTVELTSGRVRQKVRTREALVVAAGALVAQGISPTVELAAERAGISRTTAYRYFPNRRVLLEAAHPEAGAESLLPDDAPDDARGRLEAVIDRFTTMIRKTEPQQRVMLRLSLEDNASGRTDLPLRKGRAIGWIGEALTPLRDELDADQLHQLTLAIRSATGIEALVWLTDIAGLSREEAQRLMRWSALALLDSARTTPPPTRRRAPTPRDGRR
jgi:AcrR family transcriptional regulator